MDDRTTSLSAIKEMDEEAGKAFFDRMRSQAERETGTPHVFLVDPEADTITVVPEDDPRLTNVPHADELRTVIELVNASTFGAFHQSLLKPADDAYAYWRGQEPLPDMHDARAAFLMGFQYGAGWSAVQTERLKIVDLLDAVAGDA